MDAGALRSFKVPSTPRDPSAAILEALRRLGAVAGDRARDSAVVHGSTVATNALLEGRTARAALLTTAGFEDILEIGRQARPALYDLDVERPRPLVPRELRFGAGGRVLASGEERAPLDDGAVRRAAEAARERGAESLAVCFLHSYLRPAHEEQAGRILREAFGGPVSLSIDVLREFREYERCSTTAVNAAVAPVVGSYLGRLADALPSGSLRIMGSNGGAVSARRAAAEAVRTVLSGPAAGVTAAHRLCASAGVSHVLSFDMGGTSTDVSLIPGEIVLGSEASVAGYPIRTPVIEIHTVGAGGGSIAWVDAGGALKVGPRSAGAEPGPACYGRGGPPTVTDANLVLGRIRPARFLDGRMSLDPGAAARAISGIAVAMGVPLEEAASGILEVANVTMARALRQETLFRGHDPRDFALCAFGGAGGLHAADLSRASGIDQVLVPAEPGVLSAWGLLAGDVVVSRSATVLLPASPRGGAEPIRKAFRSLEESALGALATEGAVAEAAGSPRLARFVDARYRGQSHEITVSAEGDWTDRFHEAHRARYGFARPAEEVVAVTLRVVARIAVEPPPLPVAASEPPAPARERIRVWDEGGWKEGIAVERSSLSEGERLAGPAVVTEAGSTTWVPSRFTVEAAAGGFLRLRSRA